MFQMEILTGSLFYDISIFYMMVIFGKNDTLI